MPPELIALIDKPWLLILVLSIGAGLGIAVERAIGRIEREKRKAYWRGQKAGQKVRRQTVPGELRSSLETKTDLAANQLKAVMRATFRRRALLNKPERRLLAVVDAALAHECPGWRAMGQVSLGEVLSSDDKDAYFAINAKRVDLLIVDADCQPVHAIEFQGTGHHLSDETAARDAAKREALRRAGIGYVEVKFGDTPSEVREMIRKLAIRKNA